MSTGFNPAAPTFPQQPGAPAPANLGTGGTVMSPTAPPPSGPPSFNFPTMAPAGMPQQPMGMAPQQPLQVPMFPNQQPATAPQMPMAGGFGGTVMPPQQPQAPVHEQFPQVPLGGMSAVMTPTFAQPQMPGQFPAQPGFPPVVPTPGHQFLAPQAPPPSTQIRDSMVRAGYQVGQYPSDEALLNDLGSLAEQGRALQTQVVWGPQPLPGQQPAQPGGQTASGAPAAGAPAAAPAAGAPQQPKDPKPHFDPSWEAFLRKDPATGLYVPAAPHINPLIAQQANELVAWRRRRAEQIVDDPMGLIGDQIKPLIDQAKETAKREVRAEIETAQRTAAGNAAVDAYVNENAARFFVFTPQGPAIGVNGQPLMTPRGQAAFQLAGEYRQKFRATYGHDPDPTDTVSRVKDEMTKLELQGRFGPPLQSPNQFAVNGAAAVPGMPFGMPGAMPAPQPFGAFPSPQPMGPQVMPPAMPPMQPPFAAAMPGFAPYPTVPMPGYGMTPQDTMVARAMANAAMYQPQPNGSLVNAAANPQTVSQNSSLSFPAMLLDAARRRGMAVDAMA